MPLVEIFAAVRWWLVLTLLGLVVFPLVFTLMRLLPDRGYAFLKMAGLLLTSYIFWLVGSLGFSANNIGGILLAIIITAGLSYLVYRRWGRHDRPITRWLQANRNTVILTEVVFALFFVLWVWVRAQNPSITATEKPMEFAFLNSIGLSPNFPPLDPWLSGYAISYYYFGYVMTSLVARLAFVPEAIAFNLAIAWLVAGTAVGAFGLVYNLIALAGRRRQAILLGLTAVVALPLAGNMQIGLEVLHGNNVGSAAFWEWLDIRDINDPPQETDTPRYLTSSWWWWRTSRVIHEYTLAGRAEEGLEPIVEIPAFSFVLGDLHPHVLALPFAFLSLAVALVWWLRGSQQMGISAESWNSTAWIKRPQLLIQQISPPLWIFTALVVGGLSFLNTWDVLIHLFIVLGAYFLGVWYRQGNLSHVLERTIWVGILIILPAVLLYYPFYLGFRSQAAPPFLLPMLMQPTRLAHYLVIFGMPMAVITIFLISLAAKKRFRYWQTGLGLAAGLVAMLLLLMTVLVWIVAAAEPTAGRIINLANELGLVLPPRPDTGLAAAWGISAVVGLLPRLLIARLVSPWLLLLLTGLIALVIMGLKAGIDDRTTSETTRSTPPVNRYQSLPFVLLMILTGLLLTLGPEFVYLRDNFGVRLNTTFKFYYQAWVMFGIAALVAIDYLWSGVQSTRWRIPAAAATTIYGLALLNGLLFPFYAVQSRSIEYRGPLDSAERQAPTLDGLAYMQRFNPGEYEAITWLRQQAALQKGSLPVVLEAVGGQYSGYARVSANTGLPTVLGWPGHELQWRGSDNPEPGRRQPIIEQIYSSTDLDSVSFLLDQLNVNYIFVGDLENNNFSPAGLDKFRDQLDVAFANDQVTIYLWQPPAGELR